MFHRHPLSSAQESLRAVLEAHPVEGFVLKPAPASLRFRDDSELNPKLMSVAKNVLTQRGYAIRDRAALQIEIETDLQTLRPRRRVGLYADAGDSSYGQIGAQIKSPFKKSDQRAPVTRYRVYVEVRGADKLPLWRGAVRTEATGADRFRVTRDMLQLLLERIGKAIENEILFIN